MWMVAAVYLLAALYALVGLYRVGAELVIHVGDLGVFVYQPIE